MTDRKQPALLACLLCLVAVVLAVCVACAPKQPTPTDTRFGGLNHANITSRVFMDRVTGVYYLLLEKDGNLAVTPLLNPGGDPCCVDNVDYEDVALDIQGNTVDWLAQLLEEKQ